MSLTPDKLRQLDLLIGDNQIFANTTKPCKEGGIVAFAEHVAARKMSKGDAAIFCQLYKEPLFEDLFGSAYHKALSMKQASSENTVGAGADGTFWVFDGDKNNWIQLHQLGRSIQNPSEDTIIKEYRYLKSLFVYPKTLNHRVYLAWGHGLSYVNGGAQNLGDLLLARAAPMNTEHFREVFSQSVIDGSFLKINAKIPAFEAFADGSLIETVGFIPHWAIKEKQSLNPYMARSNETLLEIGKLEVVTTMPWSLLGLDEAQHFASNKPY